MKKDPAFLFYSTSFYEGTRTMLPEERACYIDLLIYQHQHGFIPDDVRRLTMYCSGINEATLKATLEAKFKLCDKGWINQRLFDAMEEREEFSQKQSINGAVGQFWKKSKAILSPEDYKELKKHLHYQSNAEIYELIKDKEINEATLQAMLQAMLEALLKPIIKDKDKDKITITDTIKDSIKLGNIICDPAENKKTETSKPTPVPVKKREPSGLHAKFTEAWFEIVEQTWGFAPKYNGMDGKKINSIMAYLRSMAAKRGEVPTDETLVQVWKQILQAALNDDFCRKNFNLAVIDNQLNRLIMLCMPQPAKRSIHDIVAEEDRLMDEAAYGIPNQSQLS